MSSKASEASDDDDIESGEESSLSTSTNTATASNSDINNSAGGNNNDSSALTTSAAVSTDNDNSTSTNSYTTAATTTSPKDLSSSTSSSPDFDNSVELPTNPSEAIASTTSILLSGLKSFGWLSSWSSQAETLLAHESSSPTTTSTSDMSTISSNLLGTSTWATEASYRKFKDRDPVTIEKSNLVNILKLVIKEVIESSLKFGRQLDSDHIPLQHFFIVLEHVLKHGLKPKKGLLGPKKELWDLLQVVEKKDAEALDITASVRELPTVKTPMGRARAWLRLALMQKKMADYFRTLVDQSEDLLSEFYEPLALIRSEEAILITGLLVSLNVVDCNLCVKEEDLDSQQGVIDFSLYLRTNRNDTVDTGAANHVGVPGGGTGGDMTAVLDQKNYIEELNRHLNATVANMQAKMESLTTTNALMKEDLAIARGALYRAQEENKRLIAQIDRNVLLQRSDTSDQSLDSSTSKTSRSLSSTDSNESSFLRQRLAEEMKRREELEKEFKLQRSMKAEMEVAMKLMEKNMHEKQDTIISLRDQLEDIKQINLEMYTKLQECQKSLKLKSELNNRLESKASALTETMAKFDEKFVQCESDKRKYQLEAISLREKVESQDKQLNELDSELKIEREWRVQLESTSVADKESVVKLKTEISFLQKVAEDYNRIRSDNANLKKKVYDYEKTMEELGVQLSQSKLQVDSLIEENQYRVVNTSAATWRDDSEVPNCQLCEKEFSLSRRKHHCRHCGGIFCDRCSDSKLPLPSSSKPVRVCDGCHAILAGRKNS